jgi:predicted amidohydrolase
VARSTSSARSTGSASAARQRLLRPDYFADPRGQLVGDAAGDKEDEVIVRDLDMGLLQEVRDLWQFYRDRRPDQYGPLAQA